MYEGFLHRFHDRVQGFLDQPILDLRTYVLLLTGNREESDFYMQLCRALQGYEQKQKIPDWREIFKRCGSFYRLSNKVHTDPPSS